MTKTRSPVEEIPPFEWRGLIVSACVEAVGAASVTPPDVARASNALWSLTIDGVTCEGFPAGPDDTEEGIRGALRDLIDQRVAWLDAFERNVRAQFPQHFGDVDWDYRLIRAGPVLEVGDRVLESGPAFTVGLPNGFTGQPTWRLAGDLLVRLRAMAEETGALKPRP